MIDQVRKDIEKFQKESERFELKEQMSRQKAEESLLNRVFAEEKTPDRNAIVVLSFMAKGIIFGFFCGLLGLIQVFKWLVEIIKMIF